MARPSETSSRDAAHRIDGTLRAALEARTRPGELYEPLPERPDWVRCYACGHLCRIPPGREGICKVRFNRDGTLMVPDGYVSGLAVDPIEKKPFFHVLPGSQALSFGMLGCDLHCGYCQNWITSQSLRDPAAIAGLEPVTPEAIVDLAIEHDAPVVTSTYNEPLITSEWAVRVLGPARRRGLLGAYVSNGNATPEVLDYLRPYVDLYKVDLKSFDDRHYRELGGRLQTVLDTIAALRERRFWVEIVTLVVPEFNDSDRELASIAGFIASVDRDIPWHVTGFHGDYRMGDRRSTPAARLVSAHAIGRDAGLHHVYAGNRPGAVGELEDTRCPACEAILVRRAGFRVRENRIGPGGRCPDCGRPVAGVWRRPEVGR
ncbi:MAG: AmmeMemoRadiSam system radical SAM enzyme [Candidatus Eiseniibacteriota bacterium]|jgi:pyruvate formate lyase activating enzyme